MNSSKNIFRLTQLVCRATTRKASSNTVQTPRFSKMKSAQEHIGAEDGIPVHLKTGFGDKMLTSATWAMVSVGTLGGFHTLYTIIYKKE